MVEDEKTHSKKAQGGQRVIHTVHHPAWDAKNRSGLPEKLKFPKQGAWDQFGPDFFMTSAPSAEKKAVPTKKEEDFSHLESKEPKPKAETKAEPEKPTPKETPAAIPTALKNLMDEDGVTVEEIQKAVAARGHYPVDTPIANYDKKYVDGVLVAAWPQVKAFIEQQHKGA